MTAFIWFVVVFSALSAVGGLCWVAARRIPERTLGGFVLDIVADVAMLAWGLWILGEASHA